MSLHQQILLLAGAAFIFVFVLRTVKASKIQVADSLFWILLSFLLVLVGLFPSIAFWLSSLLAFNSPSNFVYVAIIGLLILKVFLNSAEISSLKHKIEELSHAIAMQENIADNGTNAPEPTGEDR